MTRNTQSARAHGSVLSLLAVLLSVALMPLTAAPNHAPLSERFIAESLSVKGAERMGPIEILIDQWSSDAELARLGDALQKADTAKVLDLLHQHKARAGVILTPGVGGRGARSRIRTPHNLVFARSIDTPSGRHVIAIADEHIGLGEPPIEGRKDGTEFSLIDIRFTKDGIGIGKVIGAADVAFNAQTKMLEAKDYSRVPVRLSDVKSETR